MRRAFILFFSLLSVFLLFVVTIANADNSSDTGVAIVSLPTWFSKNWTVVALAISEAMAFLPAKFSGVVKSCFSVISAIFGKKLQS